MQAVSETLNALRISAGVQTRTEEHVAIEQPVALVYNGISHAVMLATPADLEDFALGFSLSEGIIDKPEDVLDIEIETSKNEITSNETPNNENAGVAVNITVTQQCLARLKERRRNLLGRTGCGLCGVESLDAAIRPVRHIPDANLKVCSEQFNVAQGNTEKLGAILNIAMRNMAAAQVLQAKTGAVHGAAWVNWAGELVLLREDVGRHNALDKLIGAMFSTQSAANMDVAQGFAVISSRASYEMVHKAAAAGISLLAAASAPTALAVKTAQSAKLLLAGFVRENRVTLYSA